MAREHRGFEPVGEEAIVFNLVWTGEVFNTLQHLVASQLEHTASRFRFIANACPPTQLDAMERFAAAHPGRVVEVLEVSREQMVRHGDALDVVFGTRDDGPLFSFIDVDILARRPFLGPFLTTLRTCDAVTSGRELWSDGNVRPVGHPGVSGEHFFDQDGFVFGSPHFAIYHRSVVADTMDRWGVGFSTAGADLSAQARRQLERMGRSYWIYDTAKIVNTLLQGDGHRLVHQEHPDLVHFGGVSHFLAPPSTAPAAREQPPAWGEGPEWGAVAGQAERHAMAAYTADVLCALHEGRDAPAPPEGAPSELAPRLANARAELVTLFASNTGQLVQQTEGSR